MIGVSTSPFSLFSLRKFNTWYTIADGNWSNPNIWLSNGKRKNSLPQPGDNVYINHSVTLDIASIHIKNIFISGTLVATSSPAVTITVDGDCQVSGSGLISLQSQFHNLILNGYNNLVPFTGFNAGNFSTVIYNGISDQYLLNIPYKNLTTQNGGKYQVSDITVAGNFNQQSNYECGSYNLTISGTSTIGAVNSFTFSKNSNTGSILFVGAVDFEGGTNLSGNPNVEFRDGLTIHTFNLTTGTGVFTFSTNNQIINSSAFLGGSWNAQLVIQGAITVTLSGTSTFTANNTINGTVGGSTFNNEGVLYLGNNTTPMATGVFNYQHTTTSTLGYVFNGNYTVPYTSYANLVIDGTGIKTQSGNTTINQSLLIRGSSLSSTYECGGFNLDVKGTFTNQANFTTNAFCNIIFENLALFSNGADASAGVDLRIGNPNIEFKGGLTIHANLNYTGTGIFTFSTNNQSVDFQIVNGGVWASNILISGTISVTFLDGTFTLTNYINGTLNGDNVLSTFINKGLFSYANPQQPMQIGALDCSTNTNTFLYSSNGNQDITPGAYKNLTLTVGGVKNLLGNIHVTNNFIVSSPASLNLNGFTVTNP